MRKSRTTKAARDGEDVPPKKTVELGTGVNLTKVFKKNISNCKATFVSEPCLHYITSAKRLQVMGRFSLNEKKVIVLFKIEALLSISGIRKRVGRRKIFFNDFLDEVL